MPESDAPLPAWMITEHERSLQHGEMLQQLCRERTETLRLILAEQARIHALATFARADLRAVIGLMERHLVDEFAAISVLVREALREHATDAAVSGTVFLAHHAPWIARLSADMTPR